MSRAILVRMHSSKRSEHVVCCLTFFAPVRWSASVVLLSDALPSTEARSSLVSLSVTILRASPSSSLAAFASASNAALSERAHCSVAQHGGHDSVADTRAMSDDILTSDDHD